MHLVWPLLLLHVSNVTDTRSLKQSVLQYLAARSDLTRDERAQWEKTLRLTFGGSAQKTGLEDAGVTAAKSLLAFGLFHRLPPAAVAQAAYDAKNDVYAKVPAPVAIKYQTLVLEGRRPKESSRLLAFEFPKYYDEELAPEMVSYWRRSLAAGSAVDAPRTERQLRETVKLMAPRLRHVALDGARLQGLIKNGHDSKALALGTLESTKEELNDALGGLEATPAEDLDFYALHVRLSKDCGVPAAPRPVAAPPVEKPAPTPPDESPSLPAPTERAPIKQAPTNRGKTKPSPPVMSNEEPSPPGEDSVCRVYSGWEDVFASAVNTWLGTPYVFGGSDKNGIDCSGFSREVYRTTAHFELPRTAMDQYLTGLPIAQQTMQKGDLVFFDTLEKGRITHVGIFDGEGILIHATTSRGVTKEKMNSAWLQRAYRGSRRLLQR